MKGADQCPRCASRRWATVVAPSDFYADVLRACANCKTLWEPFEVEELLDPEREPLGAFKQPCNNCAFRKGSPEQKTDLLTKIRTGGGAFYCHKGVPIEPESEHGFEYPGGGTDGRKLRLCRGYLNQLKWPAYDPKEEVEAWTDS